MNDAYPANLEDPKIEALNYWITRFIVEVQNRKGDSYLPKTIKF